MEILFVRIDPVQEIAAEPETLDTLIDILRPKADEPRASEEFLAMARASSWPLVYDEKIPPGYVHCRPTPGAPPPMTEAEVEELKARWLATYGNNQGAHPVIELRPTGEEQH